MADPVLELQGAIIQRLRTSPAVNAIVPSTRIVDIPRPDWWTGSDEAPYIGMGPTNYVTEDVDCAYGGEIMIQVDCWSVSGNLSEVRRIAGAVRTALRGWEPVLASNALVAFDHWRTDYIRDGAVKQASIRYNAIVEKP